MKLASLETFIVGTPPPSIGGRYFIFVSLETSCGIKGVGEIYAASFAPEIICTMAQDVLLVVLYFQREKIMFKNTKASIRYTSILNMYA